MSPNKLCKIIVSKITYVLHSSLLPSVINVLAGAKHVLHSATAVVHSGLHVQNKTTCFLPNVINVLAIPAHVLHGLLHHATVLLHSNTPVLHSAVHFHTVITFC